MRCILIEMAAMKITLSFIGVILLLAIVSAILTVAGQPTFTFG